LKNTGILLVQCPDRKGLSAAIADFIFQHNGNILHVEQHQAGDSALSYLARTEFSLDGFALEVKDFPSKFAPIAEKFSMQWRLALGSYRPRVAIFVSRYDHCLVDLLYRQRNGELACEIAAIISNHPDAKRHADFYGIPYHMIPVTKENKSAAEEEELRLLRASQVDLIVLARYMQVLSSDFIGHYPQQIINIHHSFLPAFIGAKPHHQAYERGVKLIGATAHYVTEVSTMARSSSKVWHAFPTRMRWRIWWRRAATLEKVVLSRAVRWHIESRILLYDNKTVIFE
jgi:formyltetrahydrofolate deformylase